VATFDARFVRISDSLARCHVRDITTPFSRDCIQISLVFERHVNLALIVRSINCVGCTSLNNNLSLSLSLSLSSRVASRRASRRKISRPDLKRGITAHYLITLSGAAQMQQKSRGLIIQITFYAHKDPHDTADPWPFREIAKPGTRNSRGEGGLARVSRFFSSSSRSTNLLRHRSCDSLAPKLIRIAILSATRKVIATYPILWKTPSYLCARRFAYAPSSINVVSSSDDTCVRVDRASAISRWRSTDRERTTDFRRNGEVNATSGNRVSPG
jgi:hypothetical protein